MQKLNVLELPLAVNVCEQMLREIDRNNLWSMAHVIMNPLTPSRLHRHQKMHEVYIITQGVGELTVGEGAYSVHAGNALSIPAGTPHKMVNTGITTLQHLVLAAPPFDPKDVELLPDGTTKTVIQKNLPPIVECFDGAQIIAYQFSGIASVAIGRVIADPKRHKPAHYHTKTTEWVYVLEGSGVIEVNGVRYPLAPSDWIKVENGETHALRNTDTHDLVVACICTPEFDMADTFFVTDED